MTLVACLLGFLLMRHEPFVVEATATEEFSVAGRAQDVRIYLRDTRVLERHMPGVVAIDEKERGVWLYRTERKMPFSDVVRTDFLLRRSGGDSIAFCTPASIDSNWMSVSYDVHDDGENRSSVRIVMRVRLVREDASSIHIFAPLLGEAFISDRMHGDLEGKLSDFAEGVELECDNLSGMTMKGDPAP
jgi:hypothetical protein